MRIFLAQYPGTYNKLQTLILQRSFLLWKKEHFTHGFVTVIYLNCQSQVPEQDKLNCTIVCTSNWWIMAEVLTKSSFAFSCLSAIFPFDVSGCVISSGGLKLYLCDWKPVSDCCSNIRILIYSLPWQYQTLNELLLSDPWWGRQGGNTSLMCQCPQYHSLVSFCLENAQWLCLTF